MGNQIKPCPRCGSTDLVVYGKSSENYYVRCHACDMQGPDIHGREEALEAWNAFPRALTWTKERPTEPGYYWLKAHLVTIVEVSLGIERYPIVRFTGSKDSIPLDLMRYCEWAGPIPAPKEVG